MPIRHSLVLETLALFQIALVVVKAKSSAHGQMPSHFFLFLFKLHNSSRAEDEKQVLLLIFGALWL